MYSRRDCSRHVKLDLHIENKVSEEGICNDQVQQSQRSLQNGKVTDGSTLYVV
jgi:hypothetical protein